MGKPRYPSDLADKVLLRMPNGMRAQIKNIAEQNRRSMNAEVLIAIEERLGREAVAASVNASIAANSRGAPRDAP